MALLDIKLSLCTITYIELSHKIHCVFTLNPFNRWKNTNLDSQTYWSNLHRPGGIEPTSSFLNPCPKLWSVCGCRIWGLFLPYKLRMRLRSVCTQDNACIPGYVWKPRRRLPWSQTHLNLRLKISYLVFHQSLGESMGRMPWIIHSHVHTCICAHTYTWDRVAEPLWRLSLIGGIPFLASNEGSFPSLLKAEVMWWEDWGGFLGVWVPETGLQMITTKLFLHPTQ